MRTSEECDQAKVGRRQSDEWEITLSGPLAKDRIDCEGVTTHHLEGQR
jgi:hypothetical protein